MRQPPLAGHVENCAHLLLEQFAQLVAAFDGLAEGALAQGVENGGGGLHAQVAGEQRGFQIFERALVHGAGEGGDAFDLGGERLAGARDRLLHAVEEALGRSLLSLLRVWVSGSFLLPKSLIIVSNSSLEHL